MATDLDFVQFIADQIEDRCGISYRKMFGEYALYSNGKVVALVIVKQPFNIPGSDRNAFPGLVGHRHRSNRPTETATEQAITREHGQLTKCKGSHDSQNRNHLAALSQALQRSNHAVEV